MNEYLIDDISKLSIYQKENNIEEYNEFVKKTALSNISNKYFARPWENHIEIAYWQGFLMLYIHIRLGIDLLKIS